MAFATSLKKGQIPVNCQLCEEDPKIQWKCCACNLLMCTKCKDKFHSKFKNGNNHRIIDIKEVGQQTPGQTFAFSNFNCQQHSDQPYCVFCITCKELICVTCITKTHNGHHLVDEAEYFAYIKKVKIVDLPVKLETKIEINVVKQFTSELRNIHHTAVCSDGSLWIGDTISKQLQHIQIKGNSIQELLRLNIYMWNMAVTPGDELLICAFESILKQVSRTGKVTDSPYSVAPLVSTAVHVTINNTVIIGAITPAGNPFPVTGRRVVMMMDQKGNRLVEHELDSNKKPLFTLPISITSTSEGNICVVDMLDSDHTGRVVVLSPAGDVINKYSGHSGINNKKPFKPSDITTTTLNNLVVVDQETYTIHILDSAGNFITYYNTMDLVIISPHSVAVSTRGNCFIGCLTIKGSPDTVKSKLHEVEFSGF